MLLALPFVKRNNRSHIDFRSVKMVDYFVLKVSNVRYIRTAILEKFNLTYHEDPSSDSKSSRYHIENSFC